MKVFLYLVALVAVLGGLFLILKPEPSAPPAMAAAGTASAPAAPALAGGAATASAPASAAATGAAPPPQTAAPAPAPLPGVFDLVIRGGKLVSGPTVIQVHKDDEVTIHLTSDTADEVHLHGYDLHVKTRPEETVTLQFTAKRTGRFGYELHHAKAELGALEVYPR